MKPTITLPELLADIASGQFRQMDEQDFYVYPDAPLGSLIRNVHYETFEADTLVCPEEDEIFIDVYTFDENLDSGAWRWTKDGWTEL